MKKPFAVVRCLPGRVWLLALLILLAVYGGVRLRNGEEAVETMTGAGEGATPQSFFDTVCGLWEG
jgi:hypothetical protein